MVAFGPIPTLSELVSCRSKRSAPSIDVPVKWISVRLIVTALGLLTREMRYDVPSQDLAVDLPRIPAIPTSGFVISNVSLTSSTWRIVIETLLNGSTSPAKPVNDPTASPLRNSALYF
jgi:hypothetical protein